MTAFQFFPGWRGAFTREQADGAIPNGIRIVKVANDGGDRHDDGARGTVLGSVGHGGEIAYFVEFDDQPKVAMVVLANRVRALQ